MNRPLALSPLPRALALVAFLLAAGAQAQGWETLSPGGGGQVQGVALDPAAPGRVWLASDVDGVYRSDDGGASWSFAGEGLHHGMAFAVLPTAGGRVYQGGVWGAHVSGDGGASWSLVAPTRGRAIAALGTSADGRVVVLGPSWLDKDAQIQSTAVKDPTESPVGERRVWVSTDGGATWADRRFEPADGYRQVYAADVAPSGRLVLGAAAGVYVSDDDGATWTRTPNPAGARGGADGGRTGRSRTDGGSVGAGLSPDGAWAYAVYQTDRAEWAVFAAPTAALGGNDDPWVAVSDGLPAGPHWYAPRVDPRSTATAHRVLLGSAFTSADNRVGLWEATVTVDGGTPTAAWRQALQAPSEAPAFAFEMGWEDRSMITRAYGWSPASWPEPAVVASGGQNLYAANPDAPSWPLGAWTPAYTRRVDGEPAGTWTATGFANTVVLEACGSGPYVVQVAADHGLLQSWDRGASWTPDYEPPGNVTHAGACGVVEVDGAPHVVVDVRVNDFGVPETDRGTVYAAPVRTRGPGGGQPPRWTAIGGDDGTPGTALNGLPGRQVRAVAGLGGRGLVALRPHRGVGGVWESAPLADVVAGAGRWRKVSPPALDGEDLSDLVPDPNAPNTVWAAGRRLWRGVRAEGGAWTWTPGLDVADLAVWSHRGATWAAVVATRDGGPEVVLRRDLGADGWQALAGWQPTGLTPALALGLRPAAWPEPGEPFEIGGLAGADSLVVATVFVQDHRRGLGVFLGRARDSGVAWEDWTEGPDGPPMYNSRTAQARTYADAGGLYYLVASRGAGAWRRQLVAPAAVGRVPWRESFALPTGTTADAGETAWTVDASALGSGATFEVVDGRFLASDTDGVGVWTSQPVAITGPVDVSLTVQPDGALEDDDRLTVAYQIDDGPEVAFAERAGSFNGGEPEVVRAAGLEGGTVRVVVRALNTGRSERFAWDDVSVTPAGATSAEAPASPAGLALAVYPNPTAGAASVRLRLAQPADVAVAVFDALGRRVASLDARPAPAGPWEAALPTAGLAPGVYLVRADAGPAGAASAQIVVVR